jgi:hypothetical protein
MSYVGNEHINPTLFSRSRVTENMNTFIKRSLKFIFLSTSLLFCANEAFAFSSYANKIASYCDSNGQSLLTEYANDTCDAACHNNSSGKSAYNSGNYDYFCPPVVAVEPTCTDADGDGYYAEGADCGTPADFNDNASNAYPGATEDCTDGIDNDGNGLTDAGDPNAVGCPVNCTDLDGDGYSVEGGACGSIDCDDNNSAVNPGAQEICSDGVDNNCNAIIDSADMNAVGCPTTCTDADGDGYSIEGGSCGAMDCDDSNPEINPAALEVCDDGVDNNCDSRYDAADSVCQSNDNNDTQQPWWRKRDWHRSEHAHSWHWPKSSHNDEAVNEEADDSSSDDDRSGRRSSTRRNERDRHDD